MILAAPGGTLLGCDLLSGVKAKSQNPVTRTQTLHIRTKILMVFITMALASRNRKSKGTSHPTLLRKRFSGWTSP